jgi:hypothetical protein
MLKLISAVMAAATIASVLTLLSVTSTRLDAGPIAKPTEAGLKTNRLTPSAGTVRMSDAQSILFQTSQMQDWQNLTPDREGRASAFISPDHFADFISLN